MAHRPCDKLSARFYGPYEVEAKIGAIAYRLRLPLDSKIHPVFHVSQLKLAHGATFNPTSIPTKLSSTLELVVEPAEVLGIRKDLAQPMSVAQVLIKWHGHLVSNATWEHFGNIATLFSDFHLEDKVSLVGAGTWIDTGPNQLSSTHMQGEGGVKNNQFRLCNTVAILHKILFVGLLF